MGMRTALDTVSGRKKWSHFCKKKSHRRLRSDGREKRKEEKKNASMKLNFVFHLSNDLKPVLYFILIRCFVSSIALGYLRSWPM